MKVRVLWMMKMRPILQKSNKGFLVHCPQCGNLLMILSKGEAVIHCEECDRDKKAIIRGGRVTVFELRDTAEPELPEHGSVGKKKE